MKTLLTTLLILIALAGSCQVIKHNERDVSRFLTDRHSYNIQTTNSAYIGLGILLTTFALNEFVWTNEHQRKPTFLIGFSTCLYLNLRKR